ncbi:hypothetical protein [Quadrisphaera sp. DSM 44207]|uniref:hypothetical protein n=1 Tax=Quadrisphaera sp. DSM 44207 TaxID=1881057 RepID=UPI000887DD68|nr:hypothetical protein [Quadrisphaera sp. DSM 44207]SDQ88969.1 hypothetical protein SAMN05428996_3041 [Quadrisphaera sp. DSM 44207]
MTAGAGGAGADAPAAPTPAPALQVRGGVGGTAAELDRLEVLARTLACCSRDLLDVGAAVAGLAGAPVRLGTAVLDPAGAADVGAALAPALGRRGALAAAAEAAVLSGSVMAAVAAYRSVDAATAAVWAGLRGALADAALTLLLPPPLRLLPAPSLPPALPPPALPGLAAAAGRALRPHLAPDEPEPASPAQPGASPPTLGWTDVVVVLGRRALAAVRLPEVHLPEVHLPEVLPPAVAQEAVALVAAAVPSPSGAPAGSSAGEVASLLVAAGAGAGLLGGTRTAVSPAGTAVVRPPRGAAELLRRVDALSPARGGPAGRVRVERLRRAGRPAGAVVYVPGTQDWSLHGSVPMDGGTNVRSVAGGRTAATDAVVRALRAAGVRRGEPVMLVGHSQGGMSVALLAADPAFRAEFEPVAVLTAGSPVAGAAVPRDVAVLSLEHADDVVPALEGASNPDTATWTTVRADTAGPAHAASGYAATGALVDASDHPSLVAWRHAAAPFLDGAPEAGGPGGATSAVATEWVARRVP